jgi:beta-lactamase class D
MFSILIYASAWAQKATDVNFKPVFDKYGVNGCFALYDLTENSFTRYNAARCDSGFSPASTFKIPNALIALEEGVVKDTGAIIKWDGHQWPAAAWNRDQTLRSAMKYSCVWVFTGFASTIGVAKYSKYLDDFKFGNMNTEGVPDRFWLEGALRISANQQLDFLRNFDSYALPVSKRSVDIVKDIIVLEKTGKYILSGKTGGGILSDSEYIMWLVGFVKKEDKTYYYALNFTTSNFNKKSSARLDITREILKQLRIID